MLAKRWDIMVLERASQAFRDILAIELLIFMAQGGVGPSELDSYHFRDIT